MRQEELAVAGAGAAGLVAAIAAAEEPGGPSPLVLEKGDRPGLKLLVSGGGRCNVTTAASAREVVAAFGPGGRFLHNALGAFPPEGIRSWLAEAGVPTHEETPGRKVFPDSGRAGDVVGALAARARAAGVRFAFGSPLLGIAPEDGRWRLATPQGEILATRLVLATGGASYPGTGTTGDAYAWLERLGHRVLPPRPALAPWIVALPWVRALSGLTLEDAVVTLDRKGAPGERGGFLFTHQGVSGPAPMNLTRRIPRGSRPPYRLLLDPLPGIPEQELAILLRTRRPPLPERLLASLPMPERPAQRSKAELLEAARRLKAVPLEPAEPMGYDKAEVTQGGLALDEVDPRTMASRIHPGLFVAGELLDLDGPIGGYNLAAAWATGAAAGRAVAG